MDPQELLLIAFRTLFVYVVMLLLVRLLGKREVGSFSAFDLIVALILGEGVDEAIYGDVSMAKFLVLIATVGILHFVNSWASYRSKVVERITSAEPTELVKDGEILMEALAKERMNEDELWAELRINSIDDIKEVKSAMLEPNGRVSVIKEDWAKELQKGDIEEFRKARTG